MRLESILENICSPKQREQLATLVMDGSGSMAATDSAGEVKGKAVGRVTRELIQRLMTSSRKDEIYLALLTFDDQVELRLAPTKVSEIDLETDFDPMKNHQNSTAIGDALEESHQLTQEFLRNEQEGLPRDAVIILMSDGCNNCGTHNPRTVAKNIKENEKITIASAAYGEDADKTLLREICSDPAKFYCEPKNGNELRDYFLASLESVERA